MKTLFSAVLLLVSTFCYSQNGGGKYSLRQYSNPLEYYSIRNPNVIEPYKLSDLSTATSYSWLNYYPAIFDWTNAGPLNGYNPVTYSTSNILNIGVGINGSANTPLDLNNFPDGWGEVKISRIDGSTEILKFTVWGSNESYMCYNCLPERNGASNAAQISWDGLIIFKQADLDNNRWNKRLWYPIVGFPNQPNNGCMAQESSSFPNFIGCKITVESNSKVVVLSGYKAFNRLYFDNGGGIIVKDGVTFTSSENMWGGLWVDNETSLSLLGLPENRIVIENANVAVMITNDMNAYYNPQFPMIVSASYPFGHSIQAFPAIVKIDNADFKNNYFHIYCMSATSLGELNDETKSSFVHNSTFDCNPDYMLAPYDIYNRATMTEACIVIYMGKNTCSFQGISNNSLDIEGCTFKNAYYGILNPSPAKLSKPNTFAGGIFCSIRNLNSVPTTSIEMTNLFEVSNQTINVTDMTHYIGPDYSYYQSPFWSRLTYQSEHLDHYWNDINGYYNTVTVNCNTHDPFLVSNNPNIARHGLSTGYPYQGDVKLTPSMGSIGIFSPYDLIANNPKLIVNSCNMNQIQSNYESTAILAGQLQEASNNYFGVFDRAIDVDQMDGTIIKLNYFTRNKIGVNINAFCCTTACNSISDEYFYDFQCNYFETDVYHSILLTGFQLNKNCAKSNVGSGNVFPVADGTNRMIWNNNDPLNDTWLSPSNWTSISNLSSKQLTVNHYINEFIGHVDPSNSIPALRLLPLDISCFTTANIDAPHPESWFTVDHQADFAPICNQNFIATATIFYPIIGREASSQPSLNREVSIYPNPTTNSLTISGTLNSDFTKATIFDLKGSLLHSISIISSQNEIIINTSNLASGLYNLVLEGSGNRKISKFSKL